MVNDNLVKTVEIIEGVQHDLGRGIKMAVIGKSHCTGLKHVPQLCQFLSLLPLGNSAYDIYVDKSGFPGSFLQAANQGCRIYHRFGVWHGSYTGETASSRRFGAGDKVFLGFLAWLTEMHMHVHKARCHHLAGCIINLGAFCRQVLADGLDFSVFNQYVCHLVEFIFRIDDPAAF